MRILVMEGCWPRGVRSPLRLARRYRMRLMERVIGSWRTGRLLLWWGAHCCGLCGFGFCVGPAGEVIGLLNVLL